MIDLKQAKLFMLLEARQVQETVIPVCAKCLYLNNSQVELAFTRAITFNFLIVRTYGHDINAPPIS